MLRPRMCWRSYALAIDMLIRRGINIAGGKAFHEVFAPQPTAIAMCFHLAKKFSGQDSWSYGLGVPVGVGGRPSSVEAISSQTWASCRKDTRVSFI